MPKSEQSLNELLYDLKRIEEHREILSESKIRKIYKSLMKELNAFIAEEYFLYADGEGVLSYATLQEKAREARFLEEVVRQVDSITPELKAEMMKLVEETYTNCYQGMQNAVINASNTQELAAVMSDTTLRPEVLKQAANNNISKLTLPNVLEKHRQEIVYNIKQELTIGMINGDRYEQMARRITDKVDISYNKAINIARTESHRNIESGLFDCAENISQGVEGSGLVYVAIWRTMKDERVRPNVRRKTKKGWKTYKSTNGADHQKMEGVTVRVGDFFEFSDGVKTKCPSKSGVARHDCNCRCFLEYDVMTEEEFAKLNSNSKLTGKITITTEKAVANLDKSGIIKNSKDDLKKYVGKPISETDNQHIREWYYANVSVISEQIDKSLPVEKQAKQAFKLRNKYKREAREAMTDKETADMLEKKRPIPSFEELVKSKMKRKEMTREEALEDILKTASKTNTDVNKEFGL